ncbi:MAG: TRAP transporter small permease [Rhodocyclaceae bacterium]|nr:TRAP transporter small permease [Rhodocyclaceae bacterium]
MSVRWLRTLGQGLGWLLDAAALVSSLLVVGLMLFLVLGRYLFGWSIVGLLEVIMMFGMWLYMLGALIASRRREHLVVDFFEQKVGDEFLRSLLKLVVGLVTAGATLFFAMLAWRMLNWGLDHPQTTPGIGIPLWIPQSAILVAAIGCAGYALRDVVEVLHKLVSTREVG